MNTQFFKYKYINLIKSTILITAFSSFSAFAGDMPKPTANGIEFPAGYQDWSIVSMTHREDNKTIRSVIGNPAAIQAIKEGKTNPWPNGAVLGKLVWKDAIDEHWKTATIPGKFVHAEFMFKDTNKWAETGGWGWARWVGLEQKPFGNTAKAAQDSCIACHTPVKNQDWVFHKPAIMPARVEIN